MQISCIAGRKSLLMVSAVTCLVLLLAVNGLVAGGKPNSAFERGSDSDFRPTIGLDEEDNILRAKYYERTNYHWPYAYGPVYGEVSVDQKRMPGTLLTQVGSFRLGGGALGIPAELRTTNRLGELGAQYFVIQVDAAAFGTQEDLDIMIDKIHSGGGAMVNPMAISSYLVRLTPAAMDAVRSTPGVTHIEPYHPAFKLSPMIGRQPLSDPFRATSEIYTLSVMLHQGEDTNAVTSILSEMGGNVVRAHKTDILVEIHRDLLHKVAALEPVFMVEEWTKRFSRAQETTNVIQTGYYFAGGAPAPSPYHAAGIRGEGEVLMVLDSGISIDAGDMSQTATVPGTPGASHRKVLLNESTGTNHGGVGDTSSCDLPSLGGTTHGQIVSATALGWATDVVNTCSGNGSLECEFGTEGDDFCALSGAGLCTGGYGGRYTALHIPSGVRYSLDGVAPESKLVFYDGNITPSTGNCGDAENEGIIPGTLYAGGTTGSLGTSYEATYGARITNFSWGSPNNVYSGFANQIDDFLNDNRDALVFVSAGNSGSDDDSDGIPDEGSIGEPATCKNCFAIGASGNANSNGGRRTERDRAFFSSVGPTDPAVAGGRIAPQLMAPGQERGALGIPSEFACRSNDNDQIGAVECDVSEGSGGTSFASPAAAGSALLVRNYFAKGFYPDGTDLNPSNAGDQIANVSGSLVKAVLIASADFMGNVFAFTLEDGGNNVVGANNTVPYRFNNEQGYGRIQLDNVLPLASWSLSPVGMIIADGGIPGGTINLSGLDGAIASGATDSETFELCDDSQELRVALAWTEAQGADLINDLNLEVQDPAGNVYWGNYFTDDNNRDFVTAGGENCPPIDGSVPVDATIPDASPWSLPSCGNSIRDTVNPTEAVFLSTDADADGVTGDGFDQLAGQTTGLWTIRVISDAGNPPGDVLYSVVVSGGVCQNSSVRFNTGTYVCNDSAIITVTDVDDPSFDPAAGLTPTEIESRVTVDVLDENGAVVDTENAASGLTFTQQGGSLRFESDPLQLSDGTAPDPGNGALDIRQGYSIRVSYQDESTDGTVLPGDILRVATSNVNCATAITFGDLTFGKVGANGIFSIDGGCEENLRGGFEFGFPDEYLDDGESVGYGMAFVSNESETLIDAEASLRCVEVDLNSPEDCLPGTNACEDPNRLDNAPCSAVTVTDSPKIVGDIPSGSAMAAYFNVTVGAATSGDEVEMILGISSPSSGKSSPGLAISRHILDVDESSIYYSTDFPGGGSQVKDYNNNEVAETVTTDLGDPNLDYRIETWNWASLLSTNPDLNTLAPFDFDQNNGGFQSGITASTDINILNQPTLWGEDLNFNGLADGSEATRDPAGSAQLDFGYSTDGGCGWQTATGLPAGDGGVWHTGLIGDNTGITFPVSRCLASGDSGPNRCQGTEAGIGGVAGELLWFEVLTTPEIHKVNGDSYTVEFVDFAWNMTQDIANDLEAFSWELDNDLDKLEPVDLKADSTVAGLMFGEFGPVTGGSNPALGSPAHSGINAGYAMFRQFTSASQPVPNCAVGSNVDGCNGSDGTNDRVGEQNCWFTQNTITGPYGTALPPDDDEDNDTDGTVDEFVKPNGPLRNFDVSAFNGPDLRVTTWEDLFGDSGNTFQAALGYVVLEGTLSDQATAKSYGATVDDVVIEWREYQLVQDNTDCGTAAECAAISLATLNFFEGQSLIQVSVIEKTPPASNDCDFDGTPDSPVDQDCDNDGTNDLVVEVYSTNKADSDVIYLNNTGNASNPHEYAGQIPVTSSFDFDGELDPGGFWTVGALFIEQNGTSNPVVNAEYIDAGCNDNPDPTKQGFRTAATTVFMPSALLDVASYSIVDDELPLPDGFADAGETIQLTISMKSNMNVDLENVVLRLNTQSPYIDCITKSSIAMGTFAPLELKTTPTPFTFKVSDTVSRSTLFEDLTASFAVTASGDNFDTLVVPLNLVFDLDLDVVTPGSGATTFTENFDGGTFGAFTTMNLDGPNVGGNIDAPTRCQYSDPENPNANAVGREACYLGQLNTNPFDGDTIYDFHVHTVAAPDSGRAFSGANSLHLGVHEGTNAAKDTMSLGQLDALVTALPINLSNLASSELSIKHQVSFVDDRTVNSPGNETPDRGIVMVKKVDNGGAEQGDWIKIAPYKNIYHIQGTDNFTECLFDPTDDGSNEDDFFDPLDPFRRLGPSSTCFPEFVFSDLGNTRYDAAFNANLTGRASEGEGLQGSIGPGTWVESKFNLARYRGFRLKLRFLYTSIMVASTATNYNTLFGLPDGWPGDDGWYIDDVTITNTLGTPAILGVDTKTPVPAATCDITCTDLVAVLSSDLEPTHAIAAPGGAISLTAEDSTVDRCANGTIQFQFWSDNDTNGTLDGNDTVLRSWTDNPLFTVVPPASTTYAVETRCSSEVDTSNCTGTNVPVAFLPVTVGCPSTGTLVETWNESISADATGTNLVWTTSTVVEAIEGSLDALRADGGFTNSVNSCLANQDDTNSVAMGADPAPGSGLYFLVRTPNFCNVTGSGDWGNATRNAQLNNAAGVCP